MKPYLINVDWSKWEDRSRVLGLHPLGNIEHALVGKSASVQTSSFDHPKFGLIVHLWIRRHDDKPIGWTELQRTKNEIMGNEVMAVQVFPKNSMLVDQANMYHLWAFPDYEFEINESSFCF